ncbi:hypothetical protein F5X68DRAFT_261777 [Plectosphaerella plurivora]|uniref:Uncharacterized protein n=1 Tax=Plectosphaerella plurivora TaxID=936078 RepID=A0A9P9AAN6_9PEZI|nr:hypothetical protein F5X68DRAFT_261777 [Plectosphaerella plurivora]
MPSKTKRPRKRPAAQDDEMDAPYEAESARRVTKRIKPSGTRGNTSSRTTRSRKKQVQMAPQTPEMTPEVFEEPVVAFAPTAPVAFEASEPLDALKAPDPPAAFEAPQAPQAPEAHEVVETVETVTAAEAVDKAIASATTEPIEMAPEPLTWPMQMWKAHRLIKRFGDEMPPQEVAFLDKAIGIIHRMMEVEPYETLPAAHDILLAMPGKTSLERFLKLLAHMAANPQLVNDQPVLHILARLLRDVQRAWHVHFPVDTAVDSLTPFQDISHSLYMVSMDYRREARYQGTAKSKHAYLSFIAFLGILVQTGALDEPNIAVHLGIEGVSLTSKSSCIQHKIFCGPGYPGKPGIHHERWRFWKNKFNSQRRSKAGVESSDPRRIIWLAWRYMSIAEENHFHVDLELLENLDPEQDKGQDSSMPDFTDDAVQEQRKVNMAKAQRDAQKRAKKLEAQVKKLAV